MDMPSDIRALPGRRSISAADVERELNPAAEQLVELAFRDVADDLDIMGYTVEQVPERHHRRLVLLRAQWRRCLGATFDPALALADEYKRLLDELDVYLQFQPAPVKPRRGKAH